MKRLKYLIAWFNYKFGWFFTNPKKLDDMSKNYLEKYIEAKENLKYWGD